MGKMITFRDKQIQKEKEMKEKARMDDEEKTNVPPRDAEVTWGLAPGNIETTIPARDKIVEDVIIGAEVGQKTPLAITEPTILDGAMRQVVAGLSSNSNPPVAPCQTTDIEPPSQKRPASAAKKGKAATKETAAKGRKEMFLQIPLNCRLSMTGSSPFIKMQLPRLFFFKD